MNILYIADPRSVHDKKWITYFVERGLVRIFFLARERHLKKKIDNKGITGIIPDFSWVRFYRTLYTALRIKRLIKQNKIDLIHIMYAEPNALWCLFKPYFDVPMIVTCRGTDVLKTIPETFLRKGIIDRISAQGYKKAFRIADWVTCTSQKQLDSVAKFLERSSNIMVVRTGVQVLKLEADTASFFPVILNEPFLFFPRTIWPIYNHELCIQAISLLPVAIKKKYQMVFLGKDRGDKSYQAKLEAKMKGVSDARFVFLEHLKQETIFELFKRASLVVMTPHSDGSPVSAIEAMIAKVPVILPPLDYDEEVFGNVFKLKSWDAQDLSDLILTILTDKHDVSAQINRAYASALSYGNFNIEMVKILKLYEQLNPVIK